MALPVTGGSGGAGLTDAQLRATPVPTNDASLDVVLGALGDSTLGNSSTVLALLTQIRQQVAAASKVAATEITLRQVLVALTKPPAYVTKTLLHR